MNLIEQFQNDGIKRVRLAFTDIDGVQRGKYVSLEKFASIIDGGAGFCDCVFGWDIDDQLYDNAQFTGWHTAFPDARYEIDPNTERRPLDPQIFRICHQVDDNKQCQDQWTSEQELNGLKNLQH